MSIPFIIDAHTHIFNEGRYRAYKLKSGGVVKKAIVIHWFGVDWRQLVSFIGSKKDLAFIGSVNMERSLAPQLAELEELFKQKKMVGLKLYPGYQHFYPSDREVFPFARLCEKYDKPLIIHSGAVDETLSNPTKKKAVLEYAHPTHIDALAVEFPNCKIIIAHLGFPHMLEAANVVSKNRNVYTEISGTITKVDSPSESVALTEQYVEDLRRVFTYFPDIRKKTMFGTDYCGEDIPLNQFDPYVEVVEKVFPIPEQKHVFSRLAEKLFF